MGFLIIAALLVGVGILAASLWRFAKVRKRLQVEVYGSYRGYNVLTISYSVLIAFFIVAYAAFAIHWVFHPVFDPIVYLTTCLLFFGSVFVWLSVSVIVSSIDVVLGVKQNEVDTMTGLMTKNSFEMMAQRILDEGSGNWSLVVIDMDAFKAINDKYGHGKGDEIIRCVADCIRKTVRTGDMVARFGGDEFLVLLRDMNSNQVSGIMARVEQAVARAKAEKNCGIGSAISYGVADLKGGSKESYASIFEQADGELYRMKHSKQVRD